MLSYDEYKYKLQGPNKILKKIEKNNSMYDNKEKSVNNDNDNENMFSFLMKNRKFANFPNIKESNFFKRYLNKSVIKF